MSTTDGVTAPKISVQSVCQITALENVSERTCQNGQYVVVERLVKKGKLKGRYKVRVVGSQKVFAIKEENLVPCTHVPSILLQCPSAPGARTSKSVSPDFPLVGDAGAVLSSCQSLLSFVGNAYAVIDHDKVASFAADLSDALREGGKVGQTLKKGGTGACRRLPLQFATTDHQINFWVVKNLLHFGSGFVGTASELADVVDRGCLSIFLSRSPKFDAEFMSTFKLHDVQEFFGLKVEEDVNVIGSAVKQTKLGGAKLPLAQLIVSTMNKCGEKLRRLGCRDFAALLTSVRTIMLRPPLSGDVSAEPSRAAAPAIASIVKEIVAARPSLDAAGVMVATLAYCFDSFRDFSVFQAIEDNGDASNADADGDAATWRLHPVYFFCNAQAAVLDVIRVLGDAKVDSWDSIDAGSFHLGADAGSVSHFLATGLIRAGPALVEEQQKVLASEKVVPLFKPDTHATNALRAASVVVSAAVCERAGLKSSELQYYLEATHASQNEANVDGSSAGTDTASANTSIQFAVQGTPYF